MESRNQSNQSLSRLDTQSLKLGGDYGIPLHVVFDNGGRNDVSIFPMRSSQRFWAQVENIKTNTITLRCLPLNVKEIRLGSGSDKKKTKTEGKDDIIPTGSTLMELKNIEEDLKDLHCYMQDLKSTRGMPLDLSHYLSIICRLQNIRDSFQDFKENLTGAKQHPGKSEKLKTQAEKQSKMTEEKSKTEKKKKDPVVKEKTPSNTSQKVGCCGCSSKKKHEETPDTGTAEELPKRKQTLVVPCVIMSDYNNGPDKQDSSTEPDSRKNIYEIEICRKNKVDRQNQVPSEASTNNLNPTNNNTNAFRQNEDPTNQSSSGTTTAKQECKPRDSISEAGEKHEKKSSPTGKKHTDTEIKNKAKKDKNAEKDPKPEVEKSSKKQKKEKSKKENDQVPTIEFNTSESNVSRPNEKFNGREYCYQCYGSEVPTITSNLGDTIKKYTGQTHSTVFLKISAVDDNLYHIHISTLGNKNLGCVFATGQAVNEAKKQKALEGYITLGITKSTTSTLGITDVKHLVDYPFELCDR